LPDVCQLRDRCVGAYRTQVEALFEIAKLQTGGEGEQVSAI
jgi:hypothetical protein